MRDFFAISFFLILMFFGVSCAPLQVADPVYVDSSGLIGGTLNSEGDTSNSRFSKKQTRKPVYYKVFPMDNNQYVEKWLVYFSKGNGRDSMKRYLERSRRYIQLMGKIFEEEGLPKDLIYISMAESGFYPYATSSAGAVGYWQFIAPTGQQYGLKMNFHVDERQDFVLSTQAAIKYLKDLYNVFEDWRLSMAAYNCGENRVSNAISLSNSRNFWHLVEQKNLPMETRNYVPKIIAMRKIALRPHAYGFSNLDYQEPLDYHLVSLRGSSSLSYISQELKVPHQELKSLNSKLKTDTIPFEGQETYVRVPSYVQGF